MTDDDSDGGQFTQRRVSAAGAEPVRTSAASSVFAMGAKASTDTPPPRAVARRKRAAPRTDAAMKIFESCGELSSAQLAEAMQIEHRLTSKLCDNMRRTGKLAMRRDGRTSLYKLANAPQTGFKAWLQRKGEPSAEGRAPRKAKTPAPVPAAAAPVVAAPIEPPITCGLFNTGEILIEAGGQAMRLTKPQAHALWHWLKQVDTALQAA